jgi:hypothetical protein
MQRSKGSLFDQLVGERKQIWRDIEAERIGRQPRQPGSIARKN